MSYVALDNRIFRLQQTKGLPDDLRAKLQQADVAFLQDRDGEAAKLVTEIEQECANRGIELADVSFGGLFGF